uniref:G-protein coupled receptors family 1 profile domain-containing protein n=1 Tax=Strigops habroptila TaxID=2489341 RepID=A0A672TUE3_STRHB
KCFTSFSGCCTCSVVKFQSTGGAHWPRYLRIAYKNYLSWLFVRWLYGKHLCLFYAFCGVLFGICSLSTLTLLITVCCLKICYPAYGNRFKREHGQILIACAWTYAAVFAWSPLAHWGEYGAEPYGTACCIDWRSTNVNVMAMSYTLVLFVFCFILPCGVIGVYFLPNYFTLSCNTYSLILVTVKESRKAVEQHVSSPTRMSNAQTTTVKVFETAFGSIDKIPPLAFAVPAVFAKSSTFYNPVIYLLPKPNFRNTIAKDFIVLQLLFIRSCFSVKAPQNYRSTVNTTQRTFKGKAESSCNSPPIVEECSFFSREKCSDSFKCFQSYPKCCQESLSAMECPLQETVSLESNLQAKVRQATKKSVKVLVRGEKSTVINSLEIALGAVPVCRTFTDL